MHSQMLQRSAAAGYLSLLKLILVVKSPVLHEGRSLPAADTETSLITAIFCTVGYGCHNTGDRI